MQGIYQKGMTLIELTVVLLILIGLAGLALPYMGGTSSKALCDATDVSMANIKKVIMDRYYIDTLGYFPVSKTGSTVGTDFSLHYLFDKNGWSTFDIDSQVGWRGPYLQNSLILDTNNVNQLSTNFKDTKFTNFALDDGHAVVLDGWGRPFVMQVVSQADCGNEWDITSNESYCARLVSAGRGSGLGLSNADIDTYIVDDPLTTTIDEGHLAGDDRILYLNVPTPAEDINPSCGS